MTNKDEKQPKTIKTPRGGARQGSGRKAGVRNKKTAEILKAVADTGETPLEYMLGVMRSVENEPNVRLDAAKSAAPYVHSKLAQLDLKADINSSVTVTMTPDDAAL